jgi:hypothetical protein
MDEQTDRHDEAALRTRLEISISMSRDRTYIPTVLFSYLVPIQHILYLTSSNTIHVKVYFRSSSKRSVLKWRLTN